MIFCVGKTMCRQNNVSSKVRQPILVKISLMCLTKVATNEPVLPMVGKLKNLRPATEVQLKNFC